MRESNAFHILAIAPLTVGMNALQTADLPHYCTDKPLHGDPEAMSGFISTMFVYSFLDSRLAFPAKPKPLLPICTSAESQSCMNLSMGLDVLEVQELPKPQETDPSPLQRIEDALRIQQKTLLDAEPNAPSYTAQCSPRASPRTNSPRRDFPNSCSKLDHGFIAPMSGIDTREKAAPGFGQDLSHTGGIVNPEIQAREETLHNRDYFVGPSLLSFFRNPRTTRAPFKPQKAGRGTSSWQLKQYAEATLGSGSLRKAVKLPEGEDKDEWLAVNGATWLKRRSTLC
jgi:MOB kinase activator 1